MSLALGRRVERIERERNVGGDWRQFGDNPRDMPDWALVAGILWNLEQQPGSEEKSDVTEVRRLYDAGQIDAAFNLLGSVLRRTPPEPGRSP
jgi:hypothetical protein